MKNKKFEEHFLRYKNLVIRIVMSKTGDYNVAQEICQQVFVSFYVNMDRVKDDMVKAWLIRCTRNAVADYYRRTMKEREIFTDASVIENGNAAIDKTLDSFEEKLDNLDLAGKVLRAVKEVNQQWFEVLFMNCVEGLSHAEAAQRLQISETVLRARLYRARMFVKERFGDDYQSR